MNVAFIPVRGGSKSIPLKNIKEIYGKPLVYWTVRAANNCPYIDKVYVATDHEKIRETVEDFAFDKVEVIGRSEASATDTASTESALLEFAASFSFQNIVLIQATSPLLVEKDLNNGFEFFQQDDVDSVLSGVRQKRFIWQVNENGFVHPENYDIYARPRRQEFDGYLVENGAFYITSREALLGSKNRISGNIKMVEMDEDTYLEIDEPSDWTIIESCIRKRMTKEIKIPEIKMFLTDSDGCLTDSGMYYSENGNEMKKFNTKDGMGFQLLREKGIITGIVTGENVELVKRRADKMHIDILKMGVKQKLKEIEEICHMYKIGLENVAYVGDDINDIEVIKKVGFGCCVKDGVEKVKSIAKYVTKSKGGQGAVREVIDLILWGK